MPDREVDLAHEHTHEHETRHHQPRGHGRRTEDDQSLTLRQIWEGISHLNRIIVIVAACWTVYQGILAWIGYRAGTSPAEQIRELRADRSASDSMQVYRNRLINLRIDTINTRISDNMKEIRRLRYDLCAQKQSPDDCTRRIFLDDQQ